MTARTVSRVAAAAGALLAGWVVAAAVPAAAQQDAVAAGFGLAVSAEDVDVEACAVIRDGEATAPPRADLLAALGLGGGGRLAGGPAAGSRDKVTVHYVLAFRQPLPAGALLCDAVTAVAALKDGAAWPPAAAGDDAWQGVPLNRRTVGGLRLATFPTGFRVRALRLTQVCSGREQPALGFVRLLSARLCNVAPGAVANAASEYFQRFEMGPPVLHAAARVPAGTGDWQNTGSQPGEDKITSPPISEFHPCWFVLSWDRPQTIAGFYIEDNFKAVTYYTFDGPEGVNPAVGAPQEWRKVREVHETTPAGRLVVLGEPVTTRGLKLHITAVRGGYGLTDQTAVIRAMHVYSDLGDAAPPEFDAAPPAPPLTIACELPAAGPLTMVVNDAAGRRVQNLLARQPHEKGPAAIGWDLKDLSGQFVPPGEYTWKAILAPELKLLYEMTPYPNVRDHSDNTPWLNGNSGPGGWLADHSPPRPVCAVGDRVYIGATCAESGVALIECDLQGRKLWGHHNFTAWTGPSWLASDGTSLFVGAPLSSHTLEAIWQVDLQTKQTSTFLQAPSTTQRKRGMRGLAAGGGRLYVSVSAPAGWLDGAASGDDVDIDNCLPKYAPKKERTSRQFVADPQRDFIRLFRLEGTPPGQAAGLTYLESTDMPAARQHIVLAFRRPVAIGSLVFPRPPGEFRFSISALKDDAPYPPDPAKDKHWTEFYAGEGSPWEVAPAPEGTVTRALRISFDKRGELDRLTGGDAAGDEELSLVRPGDDGRDAWKARLEGMKILRRRFASLLPDAAVRVNSGEVNAEGEWDARRSRPLSEADPGIYVLQWEAPQPVRGLAIKEIDGKRTEIDVWTGPQDGEIDIAAEAGWTHVATYHQALRYYYHPDPNTNHMARYIDGYVDFGEEHRTRAVRLRVVEQWTTRAEDRAGCVGVRSDRGGQDLDPTRCRVYGVAPLKYLGGEEPVDAAVCQRIEVYDIADRKHLRDVPIAAPGKVALAPDGRLYAISDRRIVRVNLEGGEHELLTDDPAAPCSLAFDEEGRLYVFDAAPDRLNVRVYDKDGKYLRSIGTAGGYRVGPWDPTRLGVGRGTFADIAVDRAGGLWVVEHHASPKRVSLWDARTGQWKKDFYGNTSYGGGGVLDPYDKSRLYYAGHFHAANSTLEFELDWKTGATRLRSLLWMGDSRGAEVPVRIDGRTYFVTRPLFGRQQCGIVYLYENDRLRRVAAAGLANGFPPLRRPDIEALLGAQSLGGSQFVWADADGDGDVQPQEVTFSPARIRNVAYFDRTLGLQAGRFRFEVEKFLSTGAPVYRFREVPNAPDDPGIRLPDGTLVFLQNRHPSGSAAEAAYTPEGEPLWYWPTEGYGVHALYSAKPFHAGQVVAEFDVVGAETATEGDLGSFFVTSTNTGTWHIWTADGLLAGRLFRDIREPGRQAWSMPECRRGMELQDVTVSQEHFSGYFCRAADGRYYVVAGHNHASVLEVVGLDGFRRLTGKVTVTAEDLARAREHDRQRRAREVYRKARLVACHRVDSPIRPDGDLSDWKLEPVCIDGREDVRFRMAHDAENLYVCYEVSRCGPLRNTGNDWRRLYKTGASVDLQIGTDPQADPARQDPVAGDLRLLMTVTADGQPAAVLYRPVDPAAPKDLAWETHTMVFRTAFDRVERLPDVAIGLREEKEGYVLEAAIPLKRIGLTVREGMRLKMDWGVLVSGAHGNEVLERLYWSNQMTQILSDEAAEAQLQPSLWAHVLFAAARKDAGKDFAPRDILDEGKTRTPGEEDILDELEEK